MGLKSGVHIDAIVERLAEMFVGMLEPRGFIEYESNLFPEQLIGMGQEVAEQVLAEDIIGWNQDREIPEAETYHMKMVEGLRSGQRWDWRKEIPLDSPLLIRGWRQTYGATNTDHTGIYGVEAFDIHDVERVTHRVITLAVQRRNELMNTHINEQRGLETKSIRAVAGDQKG